MKAPRTYFNVARIALLAASASTASIALAQSTSVPAPPVRLPVDENGVNLSTGQITVTEQDLSIGPKGEGGLSHSRFWSQTTFGGWRHGYMMSITTTSSGRSVNLGSSSSTFTGSGSNFQSDQADGSTLTDTNGKYTYTTRDGTVYVFDRAPVAENSSYYGAAEAVATSITAPTGLQTTLSYERNNYYYSYCSAGECFDIPVYITRLKSVQTNTGYQLFYSYASNNTSPAYDWVRITSVKGLNNTSGYCYPTSYTCALSGPTATYSESYNGNADLIEDVVDTASRNRRYRFIGSKLVAIKRPTSSSENYIVSYGGDNRVASFSNGAATWSYSWSQNGDILNATVSQPLGRQRSFTANSATGNITSETDALNRSTTYAHDTAGRLTTVAASEGNSTQYEYDARGNVKSQTSVAKSGSGLSNITTSATFDASCANLKVCNKPLSTTDARGNVTDYAYDGNHGGVTSITLPAGPNGIRPQTRLGYSQLYAFYDRGGGNSQAPSPIWKLTSTSACQTAASCAGASDEVRTTYGYGPQGAANNLLLTTVSTGAGDGSLTATSTMAYGVVGNLRSVDGPLAGTQDTTSFTWDAARQLTQVTGPKPDGTSRKSAAVRYVYNADGQVASNQSGSADAGGGNFAASFQTDSLYDGLGRKTRDTLRSSSGPFSITQYSYDAADRLECSAVRMNPSIFGSLPASACAMGTTGTTGPDRIAHNGYNNADELISVITGEGTAQQREEKSTYSNNGKLRTVADGNGNLTTFNYDGFDRLSQTVYPSPTSTGSSNSGDYEQLTYDAASNVTVRRLRNGATIGMAYDGLNRLTSKTLPTGGSNLNQSFAYDNLGRRTQANNANSAYNTASSWGYDALGRMVSEATAFNGANRTKTSQYDLAGRRTRLTWSDGFYVTYDYDQAGAMTAIKENGSTTLASFGYDNLGRRTYLNMGNGTSTTYGYDAVSRLQSLGLAPAATGNSYSFTYTPSSQILGKLSNNDAYAWTRAQNTNRGYTRNGLNQYTAIGGLSPNPTYDPRGNLTQAGATTYGYSAENELATAGSTRLYYDALHRLTFINGTNLRFEHDGDQVVTEYNNAGGIVRRYVFGPKQDEPLVWYEGSGTSDRRYLASDERGSIVSVTNQGGENVAINSYDEYGIPGLNNQGRFQYTGQMWLPELGMYYYKARIYSPTLGRFLQTDPIGYSDGLNRYVYTKADPVNGVDPSGFVVIPNCWDEADGCSDVHFTYPDDVIVNGVLPDDDLLSDNEVWYPAIVSRIDDDLIFGAGLQQVGFRPRGGLAGAVAAFARQQIMQRLPKVAFPKNSAGLSQSEFGRAAGLTGRDQGFRNVSPQEIEAAIDRLKGAGVTQTDVSRAADFYSYNAFRDLGNEAAAFRSVYLNAIRKGW